MKLTKRGGVLSRFFWFFLCLAVLYYVPLGNDHIQGIKVSKAQYFKWKDMSYAELMQDEKFINFKRQKYLDCLKKNIDVVCAGFK